MYAIARIFDAQGVRCALTAVDSGLPIVAAHVSMGTWRRGRGEGDVVKETHLRGTCDLGSWAHPDSTLAPPEVPAGVLHPGNMRALLSWRMSYWLNEIRCQSGYSQRELAGLIETTQPALSKWETGRNLISLDVLGRLGACTQIPIALYAELPGSRRESVIWL